MRGFAESSGTVVPVAAMSEREPPWGKASFWSDISKWLEPRLRLYLLETQIDIVSCVSGFPYFVSRSESSTSILLQEEYSHSRREINEAIRAVRWVTSLPSEPRNLI